jgi:hypothetical protein
METLGMNHSKLVVLCIRVGLPWIVRNGRDGRVPMPLGRLVTLGGEEGKGEEGMGKGEEASGEWKGGGR